MEWTTYKTKLSSESRREMKRVANAREPPVVVPVVVVAVDVHLALVVPTVERGVALYGVSSASLLLEYGRGHFQFLKKFRSLSELYRIRHRNALKLHTK